MLKAFNCRRLSFKQFGRYFMSLSYNCSEEWKRRLTSPLINNISASDHFRKVKQIANEGGAIHAVDMDILANKLEEIEPVSYSLVEQIFYKFRHSKQCLNMTASTCHALMRTLKEQGDYERLFKILEDKINYGIFLDDYTCNLLLDHFINNNLYKEALRIVSDIMLQENFDNVITKALSYYACHQYIKNVPDIKMNAPPKIPNDLEVIYRRVPYIENPWYDDHFDLYSDTLKLGKSLVMLAGSYTDVVSRGHLVIGYLLYQKGDKALQILKSYTEKHDGLMLLEKHLDYMEKLLESMETVEQRQVREPGLRRVIDLLPYFTKQQKEIFITDFQAVKNCLVNKGLVQKEDIIDKTLEQIVKDSISSEENNLVENQKKIYDTWNKERNRLIEDRERQLKIKMKKDEIAKKLIDLTQKEEKLRFYEEKTNMELKISEQPEFPKIKDVVLEEQFVAPPGERKSMEGGKKKSR